MESENAETIGDEKEHRRHVPTGKPVECLTFDDRGTFKVRSESSEYVIGLTDTGGSLARTPGQGAGVDPARPWLTPLAPAANLRVGREALTLLGIEKCRVGATATFLVRMLDGVPVPPDYAGVTTRETTIVRSIERLDSEQDR